MAKRRLSLWIAGCMALCATCAKTPQNPYENPANAKILADQSLTNVKDSLLIGNTYACSVAVSLPSLVDSVVISVSGHGSDSVIQKIAVKGASPVVFSYSPVDTGSFSMQVVIIKTDKTKDSLAQRKQFRDVAPAQCSIRSFRPSNDSLVVSAIAYPCTVLVVHPSLADSFAVRRMKGSKDSMLASGTHIPALTPDTGNIIFPLSLDASGSYKIRLYVFKNNVVKDSMQKEIIAYNVPIVLPLQPQYHVFFADSAVVRFHVTAVDSNLLGYSTFFSFNADTAKSHLVYVGYPQVPPPHVSNDTIVRIVRRPLLREGLSAPLVCFCQAVTQSYLYSSVASCTLYVTDTTRPKLTLLAPHIDSIVSLPDSIIVKALDDWAVDSVKINGAKMPLKSELLGQYVSVFSSLPQGVTIDTIIAWDKAHNTDTVFLTLKYGGPPMYPPKIKNLNRIVREGRVFDTLFLDTCITITDPAIIPGSAEDLTYREGLTWTITDSAGNTVPYNALTRKFVVPVKADSEWVDTFNLNFKVITKTGLPASSVGTFMVYEVPDPPKIIIDTLHLKYVGTPFDTLYLDTCASDPDNAASTLNWKFKNGKYFHVDSIMTSFLTLPHSSQIIIRPRYFTRKIVIAPDTTKINPATWTGSDTLTFTVTDPGGLSQSKRMIFKKWKLAIHAENDAGVWGRKNE